MLLSKGHGFLFVVAAQKGPDFKLEALFFKEFFKNICNVEIEFKQSFCYLCPFDKTTFVSSSLFDFFYNYEIIFFWYSYDHLASRIIRSKNRLSFLDRAIESSVSVFAAAHMTEIFFPEQ